MKQLFKKSTCVMIAFLLGISAMLANVTPVKAATTYDTLYISNDAETATAGVAKTTSFTTNSTGDVYMRVLVGSEPIEFNVAVKDAAGEVIDSADISTTNSGWETDDEYGYFHVQHWTLDASTTYDYVLTFQTDMVYLLEIIAPKAMATISSENAVIIVGFTKTLKVSDATGKITWSSNKPNIATVNSKGKVTAKKAGTCTITAKTADGQKLKCKVTVKKNAYTEEKVTNSAVDSGTTTLYVYNAVYNKNKGITCKVRLLNNAYRQIYSLKNVKIVIKDANKKTVASYKIKSKSFSVSSYNYKDFSVVIPASSVKKSKADLTTATVNVTGSYYYRQ